MTSTSLDIAGKIDPVTAEVLELVEQIANGLGLPYVVIGATARDLILHHHYGAKIERVTQDVDFAIQVPDWPAFEALRQALLERGYKDTKKLHRLISPANGVVDIVPFGEVQRDGSKIAWPPSGEIEMTVLGLAEALQTAVRVALSADIGVAVPVATPVGLIILKLIAWTERPAELRVKDARDITYVLESYERLPAVQDECYGDEELMEAHGWDITLAAAEVLGRHVAPVLMIDTAALLDQLIDEGIGKLDLERLVEESCTQADTQYERHRSLLDAFVKGYRDNHYKPAPQTEASGTNA